MEYCSRVVAAGAGLVLPALALAAQLAASSAPKPRFGTSVDELGFPSAGRILLVFVLIAALAVGAAVVLRRWWPAMLQQKNSASSIRPLHRTAISATVTVHVVEVEGTRMVVAEGRNGISVVILPSTPSPGAPGNTNITS